MNDPSPQKHYRISIRRPVSVAMLFLTLLVFGWKSYQRLNLNLMPDISYPTLTVRTEYENAAPEDVEKLITRPLEETLSTVGGLKQISSISSPGLSQVILEFTWKTDMNVAQQDVRDRLDLFQTPREVTNQPVILRYDPTLDPVMRVAIAHNTSDDERDLLDIRTAAEREIKTDLEAAAGIAQVVVKGGREEEIQILVDSERLKNLGMSLQTVTNALSQQNINLSGGPLREGMAEYLVRTVNEFVEVEEIPGIILGLSENRPIALEYVSQVLRGQKEQQSIVRVNGREAVALDIYKEGSINTVEVCNTIKDFFAFPRKQSFSEKLSARMSSVGMGGGKDEGKGTGFGVSSRQERLQQASRSRLPENVNVSVITDQSRFIISAIDEVKETALYGGALALVILFFFLRDLRSTLIVGVAIPISVIATFVPMFMRGISLNIMSLGGLALGVGMLVDNSIVVLESIFRCREEGDSTVDAAERGTREVGSAVTASTMTTIAVFLPIVFVEGIAGQLFGDLALTVAFSLIASLLVALYLIPMVVSRTRPSFGIGEEAVWLVRAFREARSQGKGAGAAVLGAPKAGLRYSVGWFKRTFGESVGTIWGTVAGRETAINKSGALRFAARVGAFIFLPVAFVLFILQCALKAASELITTALFIVFGLIAIILWLIGKVFGLTLWAPLALFDLLFRLFRDTYAVVLRHSLSFGPVIMVIVLALAWHSFQVAAGLGRELLPPMKQGEFGVRIETPPGTRLLETERRARLAEALIAAADPMVGSVTTEVGSEADRTGENRGENVADFTILLTDPKKNSQHQDVITERVRRSIQTAISDTVTVSLPTLFSFKTALELQIRGEEMKVLRDLGNTTLALLADIPGLKDVELSLKRGYPEVIIDIDRSKASTQNIAPGQVASRLAREVGGEIPTRFSEAGERVDIRVRADRERLRTLQDLRALSVVDGNPPLPLEEIATITVQEGPSEIRRVDQRPVVLVTGNVEGRDLAAVSQDVMERVATIQHPDGYEFLLGGQSRDLAESFSSMLFALALAVFLVYVVMACQFESVWHPFLIMFSVPLAFIGVAYALQYSGFNLSVVVFIGGIVLAGIVVNDSIVLVDYINQLRRRGLKKRDAIVEAGKVRLRPIIMTTLTTVLGLIPMILWTGDGAEMRRPMAVTVMAGLSSATILTLIIIPIIYDLFGGRDRT